MGSGITGMMVDGAEIRPGLPLVKDAPEACPECGCTELEPGFGLAGGGFGSYLMCSECSTVVAKTPAQDGD